MTRGGKRPNAGRRPGVPNKATVERALIAAQVTARAEMTGRKLAKEVLDDFMNLFAKMAERYRDRPKAEDQFEKWARLTVETATRLAPYQSPTFRAIAVAAAPSTTREEAKPGDVIPLDDPIAASRIYRRIMSASSGR